MEYFQDPATQRFSFQSYAASASQTTFAVLRFKGLEAISTPYQFDIMLVSGEADLDLSEILQSQAVFTMHREAGDDVHYNGILAEFEQQHAYNGHYFYRARLVPKLWWLMQTQHNQVFLDQAVPEIIERALTDGGMDSLDYDLGALEGTYNPVEYVCHYHESHFSFISRWMEREGIYYYFYHDADGDRLILSDSAFSHEPMRQGADLKFSPISGMEQGHRDEIVLDFTCRQIQLPHTIALKDHNPERPSLEMVVRADVDPNGRGESFIYGEHYQTPEDGERLVQFRAEELLCQKQSFYGGSTVPFLTPGFKFNLQQHYRDSFNQEYMVVEVTHEGDQTNLLKTSVIGSLAEGAETNIYSNSFKAIPASVQYRHPRQTSQPKVAGTLHGKIDGEQDSPYAQLDEQGRYKVKLPFDINDEHQDGKASARIRMMQPYAGEGKGMQFPLTKGTEVLLTFIDGNPDRPVIAGAVSTETTPSPVNAENQTESVIRTAGNNRIRMEDKSGKERIVLQSPSSGTWSRIGEPNDPMFMIGASPFFQQEGESWTDPGAYLIDENEKVTSSVVEATWLRKESEVDDENPDNYLGEELEAGDYIAEYQDGDDTVRRKVWVFDLTAEDHPNFTRPSAGMRDITSGSYWLEVASRAGSYLGGFPDVRQIQRGSEDERPLIGDMLANFIDDEPNYNPTGLKDFHSKADVPNLKSIMRRANVELSSYDTITTQEGNIYDFGGYWNYNLGNSYEEAHIDQKAKLNRPGSLNGDIKKDLDKDEIFGDILSEGGPGWTSVNWIVGRGLVAETDTALPDADKWTADNVWTSKKFGRDYDYHHGDSISIHNGASLEIGYTGYTKIELSVRSDGDIASWSHSAGGITRERKWGPKRGGNPGKKIYDSISVADENQTSQVEQKFDRRTGGLFNYSASSTTGMGTASFEFDYSNSATAKISASLKTSFEMELSAALAFSMNMSISTKIDMASLAVNIAGTGAAMTVDVKLNKKSIEVEFPNGSAYVNSPGTLKFEKKPDISLESLQLELDVHSCQIKACKAHIQNGLVNLYS